jgi:hypothetical protein
VGAPVLEELVRERQLHAEPLYGNYSGTANSDEIQTPTTGISSKNAQQQTARSRGRAATRTPAGTSTS